MSKSKILYILLIVFTYNHSAKCQKLNYNQNLIRSSQDEITISLKQADSCLKVNQAYITTKQLLIVSEKQKNIFEKQSNFFFLKADSLSLANEQLSIKLLAEKKAKIKAKFEIWTERVVILLGTILILK